jgi:hypothetical protein
MSITPHFANNDLLMFRRYLINASNYLEFGSGGSTIEVLKYNNIKLVYSIENDISWYNRLTNIVKDNNLDTDKEFNYIYIPMKVKENCWGHPDNSVSNSIHRSYTDILYDLDSDKLNKLDLILIDGRYRVACLLKLYNLISEDCVILFDDFINRKFYNIVLDYYYIIEKGLDNRMVVMKKKPGLTVNKKLIEKYELKYL